MTSVADDGAAPAAASRAAERGAHRERDELRPGLADVSDAEYDALMRELRAWRGATRSCARPTRRPTGRRRTRPVHAGRAPGAAAQPGQRLLRGRADGVGRPGGEVGGPRRTCCEVKIDGLAVDLVYRTGRWSAARPGATARRRGRHPQHPHASTRCRRG